MIQAARGGEASGRVDARFVLVRPTMPRSEAKQGVTRHRRGDPGEALRPFAAGPRCGSPPHSSPSDPCVVSTRPPPARHTHAAPPAGELIEARGVPRRALSGTPVAILAGTVAGPVLMNYAPRWLIAVAFLGAECDLLSSPSESAAVYALHRIGDAVLPTPANPPAAFPISRRNGRRSLPLSPRRAWSSAT